jgi:acyl dehydratase
MPEVLTVTVDRLRDYLGQELACTQWVAVTQEQIASFAAVTGDRQWIHVDGARARRESPYRNTVAHGFLTLAMLSGLFSGALAVQGASLCINYGLNRVRFPAPVLAGSRIRARFVLNSLTEASGAIEAVFAATVECEHISKPVCVAEWIIRFYT